MNFANIILLIPALLIAVTVHEYSHGKVADYLGDPTPRQAGRLTLNPIPHLDPFTSVLLPLVLILSGSPIVFAAAKPMPVNPFYFRGGRRSFFLVGIAGPLSNFSMAALTGIVANVSWKMLPLFLQQFIVTFVTINIILGIFNLIPIPPLDGSRVIESFLPAKYLASFESIERFGFLILLAFLIFFGSVFFAVVQPIINTFLRIFLPGAG